MLLMFERGIRGGITQTICWHAAANNKYMGDAYEPQKVSKYLQYLDINNLHGWAMSQLLPTRGFRWVTSDEIIEHSHKGYLLEVDVNYTKDLHYIHNDLPFMCEKIKLTMSKSWFLT